MANIAFALGLAGEDIALFGDIANAVAFQQHGFVAPAMSV